MTKGDVLKFLEGQRFCVMATAGADGKPEAAFIGFSIDDDLIVTIGTSKKSRKYQNLVVNPHVSLVFNFDGKRTLQYEGVAEEITDGAASERVQQHFAKVPGTEKFKDKPNQTWFVITPTWCRLARSDPWEAQEMTMEAA